MTPQSPQVPGEAEGWTVEGSNAGPWEHFDGTPCPTYWASREKPFMPGSSWWCTEHQQYVRVTPPVEPDEAALGEVAPLISDALADHVGEYPDCGTCDALDDIGKYIAHLSDVAARAVLAAGYVPPAAVTKARAEALREAGLHAEFSHALPADPGNYIPTQGFIYDNPEPAELMRDQVAGSWPEALVVTRMISDWTPALAAKESDR